MNDTDRVNEWIDNNFNYWHSDRTEYWLSLNPICDENLDILPLKLQYFVNNTCEYLCDNGHIYDSFCIPRQMGDGRCDEACNIGTSI